MISEGKCGKGAVGNASIGWGIVLVGGLEGMRGVRVSWRGRFGGGTVLRGGLRGGRGGPPFRGWGGAIVRFVGGVSRVLGKRREKGRRLCV